MARADATIEVELAWSPHAGGVRRCTLSLPDGATIADAIVLSGWELPRDVATAIWGRSCDSSQPLRDGDRLELLRPLQVDPKEARRMRHRRARRKVK